MMDLSTVKPLKNILETARDIGATDFVKYVEESGLQKDWSREGAFTLFAPTNEAFARCVHRRDQFSAVNCDLTSSTHRKFVHST